MHYSHKSEINRHENNVSINSINGQFLYEMHNIFFSVDFEYGQFS